MTDTTTPVTVDEDMAFQRREWRLQRVAWCGLAAFILAAALGIFGGGGPLSAVSVAAGPLSVDLDRFVRVGTATTLRVTAAGPTPGDAAIRLSRRYLEAVRLERITPEPSAITVEGDDVALQFDRPGGTGARIVLIEVAVTRPGRHLVRVGLAGGPSVAITQIAWF